MFHSVGIIGLGLIGGSLAKAFKNAGMKIYGLDTDLTTLKDAIETEIFEGLTDSIDEFLEFETDIIYIATPVHAALEILEILAEKKVKRLVTDACSTKVSICSKAKKLGLRFCGGHPIAGKEASGFKYSDPSIFKNAYHILTKSQNDADTDNLKKIHAQIGMTVKIITPEKHDYIFGAVSHLPHMISFLLMEMIINKDKRLFEFTGGGFKDFTRIAASDPVMWSDIFIDNKSNMIALIDEYINLLKSWQKDLRNCDKNAIFNKIEQISKYRQCLYDKI